MFELRTWVMQFMSLGVKIFRNRAKKLYVYPTRVIFVRSLVFQRRPHDVLIKNSVKISQYEDYRFSSKKIWRLTKFELHEDTF